MLDDQQLQVVVNNLQALANKLAMEGRFLDSAMAAGGVQAIRGLRTMLDPPTATPTEEPKPGEETSGAAP